MGSSRGLEFFLSPEYPFLKPVPQHILSAHKDNKVPVAGSQGAEDRPGAQHTYQSSSSQER